MSIKGSPYARFKRALTTGRLPIVLAAAMELEHVKLEDALEILVLMAHEEDRRFDRAAARWVGRLLAERPLGLMEARHAIVMVERLPEGREALQLYLRRHVHGAG